MHRACFASLVMVALSALPAAADPISYIASDFVGYPGYRYNEVVNLPSLTTGGTVALPDGDLGMPQPDPNQSYPVAAQTPIDERFSFHLGVPGVPGSSAPFSTDIPFLDIEGHVTGTIFGPGGMPLRYWGNFEGTATSINVLGAGVSPGTAIPPELLDLAAHPERIHISAVVSGGSRPFWQTTLTIDPPSTASVPEPTSLAAFLASIVGLGWHRRRTRLPA